MKLVGLAIYPLKSGAGIALDRWPLVPTGLVCDRRFMLVDAAGDFVTLRGHPKLVTVRARLVGADPAAPGSWTCETATFEHDALGGLVVPLADVDPAGRRTLEVQIWGTYVVATHVSDEADRWFSTLLGKDVHLVRFDEPVRRQVDPRYARPGDRVHFADEFPLLVMATASLDALSAELGRPVAMERFRPNLVVATDEPFVEDRWRAIRVGDVRIDLVKPCARCVGVNVEPGTGRATKEPLATLARMRTRDHKVYLGQNGVHRGVGLLSLGDDVVVVEA